MGYSKPVSTGVMERLVGWYLHCPHPPMTLLELTDMAEYMIKPYRSKNYTEESSLRSQIHAELHKRTQLNKQIKSRPVAYGS